MSGNSNTLKDQIIWDQIFAKAPSAWKKAEPSLSMIDCLQYFKRNNIENVLDLGCGVGIWSIFLAKSEIRVKGVDFSKNAIDFAREWAEEENLTAHFDCASLTDHYFTNESFDGIVAAKVLDNISREEFQKVKDQINTSLKKGGILFCLFNPNMSEIDMEKLKNSDNPTKGITHIIYNDEELKQLFPDLTMLELKYYENDFRGLILKKE